MIDRKRLTLIVIGGIVALLIIIGLVVAVVFANKSQEPTSRPTAAQSQTAAPAEQITFTDAQQQTVNNTAKISSSWNGATDPGITTTRYEQAGMSSELARTYKPIWAEAFGSNITAEITTTISSPVVVGHTGAKDAGLFRVSMEITYQGTWRGEDGTPQLLQPGRATWFYTLDERSGKIVQIDQPALSEIEGLR